MPWVKDSILKYHEAAKQRGIKIVHCCGFDSVPSDLGALLLADYAQRVLGKKLDKVRPPRQAKEGGAGDSMGDGGRGAITPCVSLCLP